MKHLKLIVLRELSHFRGWFHLLIGLAVLVVLLHVLVMTAVPGERVAEYLMILKSYGVPVLFGILCALMGYADSPEHGSHEFRARPVRLKTLYFGKIFVIAATSIGLVFVQATINWFADFPLSFWALWLPLLSVGLCFFFLAAILKTKISSVLQLLMVVSLPFLLSQFLAVYMQSQESMRVSPRGIQVISFVFAVYFLMVFLGKNFVWPKVFWFLVFPILALVVAGMPWLLPLDQSLANVEESLEERLRPELRFANDDEWLATYDGRLRRAGNGSGGFQLNISEIKTDQTILQHLEFRNQVVEIESGGKTTRQVRHVSYHNHDFDYDDERDVLRALGITPAMTEEELARQRRYRQWNWSDKRWEVVEISPEMVGKEIEIRAEGKAYLRETKFLGSLDIREGAKVSSDDLTVEIVNVERLRNYLILRVYSRGGAQIHLGAYQKNSKYPHRPYGLTHELTCNDVINGISVVDILTIRLHLEEIEESDDRNVLHLFSVIDRGSLPFQSKPLILDAEKTLSQGRPIKVGEATYPILPSVIPIEKK